MISHLPTLDLIIQSLNSCSRSSSLSWKNQDLSFIKLFLPNFWCLLNHDHDIYWSNFFISWCSSHHDDHVPSPTTNFNVWMTSHPPSLTPGHHSSRSRKQQQHLTSSFDQKFGSHDLMMMTFPLPTFWSEDDHLIMMFIIQLRLKPATSAWLFIMNFILEEDGSSSYLNQLFFKSFEIMIMMMMTSELQTFETQHHHHIMMLIIILNSASKFLSHLLFHHQVFNIEFIIDEEVTWSNFFLPHPSELSKFEFEISSGRRVWKVRLANLMMIKFRLWPNFCSCFLLWDDDGHDSNQLPSSSIISSTLASILPSSSYSSWWRWWMKTFAWWRKVVIQTCSFLPQHSSPQPHDDMSWSSALEEETTPNCREEDIIRHWGEDASRFGGEDDGRYEREDKSWSRGDKICLGRWSGGCRLVHPLNLLEERSCPKIP